MPVEPMAVFAVLMPDPRKWKNPSDGILSASTLTLTNWRSLEAEKAHFVSGRDDLAYTPFYAATLDVLDKVQSASEQIN